MISKELYINGQFCARRLTGEERFAEQIVLALDKINTGPIKLIIPKSALRVPNLKNIEIVRYGNLKGLLWEQICFCWYTRLHKAKSINLCSIMPIFCPGIVCIHDIKYKTGIGIKVKQNIYQRLSKVWHLFQYHLAWRFATSIITVSEYSKKQIMDVYHVSPERILVIGNGWDHFKRIEKDDCIFVKKGEWFVKPYFFSVSSITPNKNLNWIIEVAKRHPQYSFLVSGNLSKLSYGGVNKTLPDNVILTGYLSDGEVKSVMTKAKAFLFPSYAEGFGIPPLEALSVGCTAIVSNTTCLPEIFGNSVHYINPKNANVNLDDLLAQPLSPPDAILKKYTYEESAKLLYSKLSSL